MCNYEVINSTTLLYGRPEISLWNLETNKTVDFSIIGHHECEFNSNNNTSFTIWLDVFTENGSGYIQDKIMEFDLESNAIWNISTRDFVKNEWLCPYHDIFLSYNYPDIARSNTIFTMLKKI